MRSMVTGDQNDERTEQVRISMKGGDAGTADAPGAPGFIEIEPLKCSCQWATMDTGNAFYSRRTKPDPKCQVHRR